MSTERSLLLRRDIIEALRRGTVPRRGLELFAVGTDRFEGALSEELERVASGGAVFKAIRGDFGCGKSFTARWFQQQALNAGFAVAEVQISENDTPLHKLETIYRRAMEGLRTREWDSGAFRALLSEWLLSLEDEVIASGVGEDDPEALSRGVGKLLEGRLATVSAIQPQFAAALRACHEAQLGEDYATAEGLMGWLMAQPNVGASVKRKAGLKGDVDHTGALGFLRGLLTVLSQAKRKGLLLVLDEVETIQRVRSDSRERSLNALRQLIDDLYGGRFPGLYVLITGTPAFFDGPHGVRRSPPLTQRLHVDFNVDPTFDNTRDVQLRLQPFDLDRLCTVGRRVRDLYPSEHRDRIQSKVTDEVIGSLARGVAGKLGGRVGVAPRIFLRKLVAGLLDGVDMHPTFEPTQHFKLVVDNNELTAEERHAAGVERSVDDIELDLTADDSEGGFE
jgi:hypothetical protein